MSPDAQISDGSMDYSANARAASSDAEYRTLANALPHVIWTCDAQGRLEWVNDRWRELTGQSEEDSRADKRPLEAVHPDDREHVGRRWTEILATSMPSEFEYRIRTRQGEYRWHVARIAPLHDADGRVVRWVASTFDIQDRRETEDALRASERRFEAVFDLSPQPTGITRLSDGTFISVNDAFLELTGYSRREIVGHSMVSLGIWSAEERATFIAATQRDHRVGTEVPFRTRDGGTRWLMVSNARVDIDGESCLVNVATDVTDQRAAEAAIRASEAALRLADQRKDDFLALLAHELRNPLAPILTSARLLERRGDPEAQHDLDVIIRQVKHLVRLVDDLLDVSRVARGRVTLTKKRLELSTVVSRAVEATGPLVDERQHKLVIAVPPDGLEVDADEVRLTQVVNNLLTNAAHYTPAGGTIAISATREANDVVLRVRDSGVGIDQSLLPDLFETFVQGSRGLDRAEGGLGLGLSLVRTLTELHGGTVAAHSDGPGRGSEFAVRLPASVLAADTAASVASQSANRQRDARDASRATQAVRATRVLAVDDNADVVTGVARVLELAGYEVQTARDPIAAITVAEAFRPHVALLDIGLPVMDGYALGRELRARLGDAAPILVALTGYGEQRGRRSNERATFVSHLVKPVDMDELVGLLDRLVASAGSTGATTEIAPRA